MNNFKNLKKYLPSKTFSIIFGVLIFLVLVFMFFSSYFFKNESFTTKKESSGLESIEGKTIDQIVNTDTDLDSVFDWEESLWGTDKNKQATFDNIPDAVYIADKKNELNIKESDNQKLNATEEFARQYFASYVALKSSGGTSQEDINDLSKELGKKIADPNLENIYSESNIKYSNNSEPVDEARYYITLKEFFDFYRDSGIGDELDIVTEGLANQNTNLSIIEVNKLSLISDAYIEFSKKVISTRVPETLKSYHLNIANDSFNMGMSIKNMMSISSDPIIGISGFSSYKKYSDDLVDTISKLETELEI